MIFCGNCSFGKYGEAGRFGIIEKMSKKKIAERGAERESGQKVGERAAEGRPGRDGRKVTEMVSGRMIFYQAVILFVVGCVFGTYWEEIMHLVTTFWATGTPIWESRRGLVYGPFSPVYGIGAVLIYLVFYLPKVKGWVCFVGGAIFGGALEYILSVLQEWIFGTRSWDYSDRLLDIGGRTTVPYMIVWGALVFLVAKWICPFVDEMCQKVEAKKLQWVCVGMAVFLMFDVTVSVAAVWRQTERREGDPANTRIEQILDRRFPDERLQKIYSNTKEAD